MKKILILLALPLLFIQCNENQKMAQDAQMRSDSLQRLVVEKDSAIYAVLNTFNEIENNLETIKSKEKIIAVTAQNVEDAKTREEKINEDINMIYALMLENKDKVSKLENQLKRAQIKNNDLQNTIKVLQDKLAEKNAEIIKMRGELLDLNLKIDDLTYSLDTMRFENEVKSAIIKAQDESLNTAYYLFGSEKELKEMEILDKKGGFIGIGSGKNLNKDFNKELFTPIDIRNQTKFELNSKKIKIITTHPTSAFQVYGEKPVDSLVISNPQEFWSVSKYLVIVLN
jgi:cation transport regulator ChaC